MDLNTQLEDLKKQIKNRPLSDEESDIQLYGNYLEVMTQLAEEHMQEHYKEWENVVYVKEYLHYAPGLLTYANDAPTLYRLGKRLTEVFSEHPRLKMILLNWLKHLLSQPEVLQCSGDAADVFNQEISTLQRNIRLADTGKLDQIGGSDFFKIDPVEWTEKWENCIDEVYEKLEQKLSNNEFQIGCSLQYWKLKAELLKAQGIDWKSPAVMNPDFIFD